jgi:hypothetical protein
MQNTSMAVQMIFAVDVHFSDRKRAHDSSAVGRNEAATRGQAADKQ